MSNRRGRVRGSVYSVVRCTQYEISKLPEQFTLVEMARSLKISVTAVRQWITTPFLLQDGSAEPTIIPPLKVHKVKWKGTDRIFIFRSDLLEWLKATHRLFEPRKGVWSGP